MLDAAVHFYFHHLALSLTNYWYSLWPLKTSILMISIPLMLAWPTLLMSVWAQPVAGADSCNGGLPCPHIPSIAWPWISCPSPVCSNNQTTFLLIVSLFYVATSTDVESSFSWGGLTVSKMWHSLSDESNDVAAIIGSWCDFPSAIPREDIVETFKDKSKRSKGK